MAMRIEIRMTRTVDAQEIEVVQIFISSGMTVKQYEPMFEVATDKANEEIVAPESGTIIEVLVSLGDIIEAEQILATLETEQS
jgi:dihydrolipoamide dehydrogenase